MDRRRRLVPALALLCVACPSGAKDPPPPEETTEIASAAPRAVGALAGGTDAAPPAVFQQRRPNEDLDGVPIPELEADGGVDPDAGTAEGDELPL